MSHKNPDHAVHPGPQAALPRGADPKALNLDVSAPRPRILSRLHLALTLALLLAVLALSGMAATGRVRFGKAAVAGGEKTGNEPAAAEAGGKSPAGRYQIEQVEDARDVVQLVGQLGYFGESAGEAWVFRYSGGFLESRLETDFEGKSYVGEPLPGEWKNLLSLDQPLQQELPGAFQKRGYVVLAEMRTRSVASALGPYHVHLSSLLAGAPVGPLHVLVPLHFEVRQKCPYRLMLTAGPLPKTSGTGFNVWGEEELLMRGPLVPRNPQEEDYHAFTGKDLTPGKDIVLLDRERGYSRFRLKVRFLGDGEVRQYATRK